MINEGLPLYIINRLNKSHRLKDKSVGILGMAFKEGVDDKRDSLSYKLKALIEIDAKKTYCSDVYINEPGFVSAEELVKNSDIIIVGAPHKEYAALKIGEGKTVVDIWNLFGKGSSV
jgi:UDP-N-acetyl-D-mannosaminuronic acid dehydrogenase